MSVSVAHILEKLALAKDLDTDEAGTAFAMLFDGNLSEARAGALLMGLRAKGETALELTAAVKAALARAKLLPGLTQKRIDTCGTGGDNSSSFNCSTATALFLTAMGYQVVKHGNRSVSSSCGSADAVEALGLPMPLDPVQASAELAAKGFVFLFAPHYHPSFKHIMPVRKELGIRTLFNLMGPLLNPARPTRQLLGVARPEIMQLMAEVLSLTGVERAAVVHGASGFDELTPFGPAKVIWVGDGKLIETEFDPAEFGVPAWTPADVAVTGKDHALAVLREILSGGGPQAMRDMLALNLAMALHLLEDHMGMAECMDRARGAIKSGVGKMFL